jgi:hypothetical protein
MSKSQCAFRCGLAFGICIIVGCGPSRGTVSGKVTYKDKSVTWGTVSLFASDNMQYSGEISSEGTYTIANVPAGAIKACVVSPNPDAASRAGFDARRGVADRVDRKKARPPVNWFAIPEKYADISTTTLLATVNAKTTFDLKME